MYIIANCINGPWVSHDGFIYNRSGQYNLCKAEIINRYSMLLYLVPIRAEEKKYGLYEQNKQKENFDFIKKGQTC